MVATFLDEASIGLVAFCLLMWVTVPASFSTAIDNAFRADGGDINNRFTSNEKETPRHWLAQSTNYFLVSGVLYLLSRLCSS